MKTLFNKILITIVILIGFSISTSAQCTYSICLYDTYGDGWNGGSVSVIVNGTTVLSGVTLSSGSGPACYNFTVSQGQSISVTYTAGSWSYENYYQVYNSASGGGTMIYGSTSGSTPPSSQSVTNSCIDGGGGTDCTHSICLYDTYGDGWNGGSVTVNVGGTNVVSSATLSSGYGPTCYNFNVTDGESITVTYSEGSWGYENYYQIYSSSGGSGTSLYNSGSGSTPPSSQVVTANCSGGGAPSGDCMGALPFCTSDSYIFPASTNVPDMGSVGCLYTTPNPAWYWMEIGSPGNIDIYMSSGGDVDFIAWGPFTSLTAACASDLMNNSGVDCSYSTAAQETANLTNTQTGEVYVLLITNYANIETNISFSQTGGAGSTNCGIIAPPITNNGPLCEGETLELTVSNPTAGATYNWSGPNSWTSTEMNPTITNVTTAADGTYSLIITVGAETSDPVTTDVVVNSNVTPTFSSGGTYCSGESIPALPTTATNGITGSWSPSINNTATTTYTFTPTTGQCALTTNSTITITPNTTPTFDPTGTYCYGESIPALPTTSNNGINGSWSPSINNTATTTYTFTPNSGQCALTTTSSINITPLTIPTFTQVGPYCEGDVINPLPTTSTNGITGTWSPAINNTSTTTYTFTPTAGQCANTTTMTITINPNITPTFTSVGPFCSGTSISALPTTSNNGIDGSWSPAINNTTTTTYHFTPTSGQCALNTDMQIEINENILPTFDPIGPYCFGTPIPDLPTTSTNGISGTWSPMPNNTTTTTYTFTPTSGQCAINTTTDIEIELLESSTLYITNQFCDAYGTASVSGLNGTPPYSFFWPSEANGITEGTATILVEGNYTVTVNDAHGCQSTESFTIGFTDNLEAESSLISNPDCNGYSTGSVSVNVFNGTGPYTISWDSISVESSTANYTMANLIAGNYQIDIIDNNGCIASTNIQLIDPPLLIANSSYTQIPCSGETAFVTITGSGGTPSYTGTGTFEVNSGTYTYTITDYNGCTANTQVTIPQAPAPLTLNANINNISCYNYSDGSITALPSGGTPPYDYEWDDFTNSQTNSNLSPGTYTVTVTDYNSCTQEDSYLITEPIEISLQFTTTDIACFGSPVGGVQMTAEGGMPPYNFEIYNQQFTAQGAYHNNLPANSYTIEVIDSHSCSTTKNISIQSPAAIEYDLITNNPSCIGNDDGSIEILVSGGTEPYSFVFDDIYMPTNSISGLTEGYYNAQIIDANNCVQTISQIALNDNPIDCINIPNAFTPNNDGINDTWIIQGIDKFPNSVLQVYNRWGQAVFSSATKDKEWDAYFNGKLVPAGTYVFYLILFNGNEPYTGTVTVVH